VHLRVRGRRPTADGQRHALGRRQRRHQLPSNYRSRPELVDLCSELFSRALAPHGYTREEVAVTPQRPSPPELASLPPLGLFTLTCSNVEEEAAALARGVQRLLAHPNDTPIVDRHSKHVRPLQPGDVAVLVRTNAEAENIARELGQLRIRCALSRPGLLSTPEGCLVDAALSFLLDRTDGVASASLDALHGFIDGDPDRWLDEQIRACHARRDAAAAAREAVGQAPPVPGGSREPLLAANDVTPQAGTGWRAALATLANQSRQLSPRETIDAVIQALDVHRLVLGWPDPEQRGGNLDALRALASQYEDTCRVTGAAASLAGLLDYFDRASEARWDGSELRASDEQHFSQGPGAVVLCTYHRSKGLEWPVVVLASLDAGPRADAFGVKIQSPPGTLDARHPLAGRWIRYVPRPLTGRSKGLGFVDRESQSREGLEARQDERCERARLLYVGFTRARDHLILAARNRRGRLATGWLDELQDGAGDLLLPLPIPTGHDTLGTLRVNGTQAPVAVRSWEIDLEQPLAHAANDTRSVLTWRRPVVDREFVRPSYWIAPSSAAECWPELPVLRLEQAHRIGPALGVRHGSDVDWAAFGDTVHGFLAADRRDDDRALRLERARRLLVACTSGARLEEQDLLAMSDALATFVEARWPGAAWHREVPIRVRVGAGEQARRVNGGMDLLIETPSEFVVIDHKTYGNPDPGAVRAHSEQYLPQLAAYGEAIGALGGKRVGEYWLHFGVTGWCVRCVAT